MGVNNYVGLCGLSENMIQLHRTYAAGANDVSQNISGPHGRQLVGITHHDKPGALVYSLKKGIHKEYIHHGHLIDDYHIALQRIQVISFKMSPYLLEAFLFIFSGSSLVLQKSMDSGCRPACGLRHPLCGSSGRGSQKYGFTLFGINSYDGIDGCGLSRTGTSRDDEKT